MSGGWRAVALLAVAAAVPPGARAQAFDAKPGAWEMTTTMTGDMVPPDVLAKMPLERRAMVEKLMAEHGAGAGKSVTRTSCVTKEDLSRDAFGRSPGADCTAKTVTRTSTKLVMETTCAGPPAVTGTLDFEAKTPESVVGRIDQRRSDGSTFHVGLVGRWLGARCAGIPPAAGRR